MFFMNATFRTLPRRSPAVWDAETDSSSTLAERITAPTDFVRTQGLRDTQQVMASVLNHPGERGPGPKGR